MTTYSFIANIWKDLSAYYVYMIGLYNYKN